MLDHSGNVGGVVIHVVTVAHLRRAAMAAPVMCNDAIAFVEEIEHLRIPIVGAKRPPMVEDDRLGVFRSPVLVMDFRAVCGFERGHGSVLSRMSPFELSRYAQNMTAASLADETCKRPARGALRIRRTQ